MQRPGGASHDAELTGLSPEEAQARHRARITFRIVAVLLVVAAVIVCWQLWRVTQAVDDRNQATSDLLAVQQFRVDAADMNGQQNLIPSPTAPDARARLNADEAVVERDLRELEAIYSGDPQTGQLVGQCSADMERFLEIDKQVAAAVAAGDLAEAQRLVEGPATDAYTQMQADAAALADHAEAARSDAASDYSTTVRTAAVLVTVLVLAAAGLVLWLVRQRRKADRRLARTRGAYRSLVEHVPAVILRADADGTQTYVSPQIEQALGYTPDEWLEIVNGPHGWDLIHPDDRERVQADHLALRAGRVDAYEAEFRIRARDGDYRTCLQHHARIVEADGRPTTQSVAVDITELRDAERRSHDALAQLVTSGEQEQARIAAELHDDTVQVMTAVLMQLGLLSRSDPSLKPFEELLREALERTRRLMFELYPRSLEREGLGPALAEVAAEGPWKDAQVEVTMPRQTATLEALCYRTVRELVINARKHSRAQHLLVRGWQEDGQVRFLVEDDGVGFDPARALGDHGRVPHLGLEAVIERVRLAQGELTIESSAGNGSRFLLALPAAPREG